MAVERQASNAGRMVKSISTIFASGGINLFSARSAFNLFGDQVPEAMTSGGANDARLQANAAINQLREFNQRRDKNERELADAKAKRSFGNTPKSRG
ncbi:MAG: hypothetical protein U0798_17595 [Gemmataceae bacterium]